MEPSREPSAVSGAPLATYSERLLEVRRDFALYPDRVVVTARWLLRGHYQHIVQLRNLTSGHKRLVIRYRMYRIAGWVLALGSLAFAAIYYSASGGPIGVAGYAALSVAVFGAVALALAYPLRRLEFARFDTRAGRPGLDIGGRSADDPRFTEFVRAVDREIRRQ